MLVRVDRREEEDHRGKVDFEVGHLSHLIIDHVLHKGSAHAELGQELDGIRTKVTSVAFHCWVLFLQRHDCVARAAPDLPQHIFVRGCCQVGINDVKGKREVVSVLEELVLVVFVEFVPRFLGQLLQVSIRSGVNLVQAG